MKSPKLYSILKLNLMDIVKSNYDFILDNNDINKYLINQQDNAIFTHIRRITNDNSDFNKYVVFVECKNGKNKKDIMMRILTKGFSINGVRFLVSEKSASMSRQAILMAVRESIYKELTEIVTMGVEVEETVLSKYLSYRGLQLSSSFDLPDYKPYCIVIDDYEKIIPNQKIRCVYDKEKIIKIEKIDNNEKLKKFLLSIISSKQVEEIYKTLKDPLETLNINQSYLLNIKGINEKTANKIIKKFQYNQDNVGKEIKFKEKAIKEVEKSIKITPFDGIGCMSSSVVDYVQKELNIEERPSAFIFRMAFCKGLLVELDFVKFCSERGIFEIKDIWGHYHSIYAIDIIMTKSQFKAFSYFNKTKSYQDFEYYWEMFEKYQHSFRVNQWNFSFDEEPQMTKANYQVLQTQDLNKDDFISLADYTKKWIENIVSGEDLVSVLLFLGLKHKSFKLSTSYMKAILKNPSMINDPQVKNYLHKLLTKNIDQMKIGKIFINGSYQFLCCDVIAFLEYICGLEVYGFLKENEFYSQDVNGEKIGEYTIYRSPHIASSENRKLIGISYPLINEYAKGLSNVCMVNHKSLILNALSGADLSMEIER